MLSDSESNIYTSSEGGSSGNEADSEDEEAVNRKEMDEMIEKLKNFIHICMSQRDKSLAQARHRTNRPHQNIPQTLLLKGLVIWNSASAKTAKRR